MQIHQVQRLEHTGTQISVICIIVHNVECLWSLLLPLLLSLPYSISLSHTILFHLTHPTHVVLKKAPLEPTGVLVLTVLEKFHLLHNILPFLHTEQQMHTTKQNHKHLPQLQQHFDQ